MEDHLHHRGGVKGQSSGAKLPADLKQPVQQHADGGPSCSAAILLPAASDAAAAANSAPAAVYAAAGSSKAAA